MKDPRPYPNLNSLDPEQRRQVVSRLARTQDEETLAVLVCCLGDEDWRVRKEAIAAAVEMGPGAELLSTLVSTFTTSDNVGLRNAVAEALGRFGRAVVGRLEAELCVLDADGRKLAAEALGRTSHYSAVVPLSRLLNDSDINVRVAAIEALGLVGGARLEVVQPLLCSGVERGSVLEKLAALESINALGLALPWDQLATSAEDPVMERAALTAAARTVAGEVAAPLVAAFVRQSELGEVWPVLALAEYVSSSNETLESARAELSGVPLVARNFLYQLTEVEEFEVRSCALKVVGALGDEEASRRLLDVAEREEATGAADHLLGALANLSPRLVEERLFSGSVSQRTLLLRTLARQPNLLRPSLVMDAVAVALAGDDEHLLGAALEVLEATSDERCFRLLVGKMGTFPSPLRRTAEVVLQEMALRHVELARAIASQNQHSSGDALAAAVLLGALCAGGYGSRAGDREYLARCLTHDSCAVRCVALDALAAIGDPASAEAIAFCLADEELEVRLAAVNALGGLHDEHGTASTVERLIDLAQRTCDRELLVAAIQALGESTDARVLPVLRPIARSGEPAAAVAAVEAIGRVEDPRRFECLIEGLSHRDVEVVKATMGVLINETDVRVEAHLGACLDHDTWDVRRLAADLLGSRGGEVACGLLRAKRATEQEPLVNEAIDRSLSHLEGTGHTRRSSPVAAQGSWRPQ